MVAEQARQELRHRQPQAFGPGSILWDVTGDVRSFLSLPSAFAMQGLHPVIGVGIEQHSTVFENPYKRSVNSLAAVYRWVYGGQAKAEAEREWLLEMHKSVKGVGHDGERYSALSPGPYAWVWATAVPSLIQHVRHFDKMEATPELEEQLYEELKQLAVNFGVNERFVPATLDDFWAYWDYEVEHTLEATPLSVGARERLREGKIAPPPGTPSALVPAWRLLVRLASPALQVPGNFVAGALMPPRARELAGIKWTPHHDRAFRLLAFAVRNVMPLVPEPLRYTPYAAKARRRARKLQ